MTFQLNASLACYNSVRHGGKAFSVALYSAILKELVCQHEPSRKLIVQCKQAGDDLV